MTEYANNMQRNDMRLSEDGFGDMNWCVHYCNEIQDQGNDCNSGWAFASIAATETIYAINYNSTLYALSA